MPPPTTVAQALDVLLEISNAEGPDFMRYTNKYVDRPGALEIARAFIGGQGVRTGRHPYTDAEDEYLGQDCPVCLTTGLAKFGTGEPEECVACFGTGCIPLTSELQRRLARARASVVARQRTVREGLAGVLKAEEDVKRAERDGGRLTVQVQEVHTGALRTVEGVDAIKYALATCKRDIRSAEEELPDKLERLEYLEAFLLAHRSLHRRIKEILKVHDALVYLRGAVASGEFDKHFDAAAAPPPAPAKCRTPKCGKAPQVWDTEGRGWCRRHAHRRGLMQAAIPEPKQKVKTRGEADDE